MSDGRSQGFIKLWRGLRHHRLWLSGSETVRIVAVTLLLYARWEEGEWTAGGKTFSLKPGDRFWTYGELMAACGRGMTKRRLRTALDTLETWHFLVKKGTHEGMVISIENWGKYQGREGEDDTPKTRERHAEGTPKTREGHAGGTPIYTKNVKNIKNTEKGEEAAGDFEKKILEGAFFPVPPGVALWKALQELRQRYGESRLLEALSIMRDNGASRVSYAGSILARWERSGYDGRTGMEKDAAPLGVRHRLGQGENRPGGHGRPGKGDPRVAAGWGAAPGRL